MCVLLLLAGYPHTELSADGFELIIMIVGTFAQATAGEGQAMSIIAMLIFWRFIVRCVFIRVFPGYLSRLHVRLGWELGVTTHLAPLLPQNSHPLASAAA